MRRPARLLAPALAAAVIAALPGCRRPEPAALAPAVVGLVIDVGGRGDASFNDGALRGLEMWAAGLRYTPRGYQPLPQADLAASIPPDLPAAAVKPLGVRPMVLQSKAQEDYQPNLELLAAEKADLVVGVGFLLENAVEEAARKRPGARFLLIDSPLLDARGRPFELPNVRSLVFREQEGSFLVGALAGFATRSGAVGFVGGMEVPLIERFEAGFAAGARTARPGVVVKRVYTGNFDDSTSGKRAAETLLDQGVDVVFHGAGSGGLGVIQAARERGKLAIGVDSDQSFLAPGNVLTSMLKHVDYAVYLAARDAVEKRFTPGVGVLGLAEGGLGLAPVRVDFPGKAEALEKVEAMRRAIVEGRLRPPATLAELARFVPPRP
jgi:basic membrane protein A